MGERYVNFKTTNESGGRRFWLTLPVIAAFTISLGSSGPAVADEDDIGHQDYVAGAPGSASEAYALSMGGRLYDIDSQMKEVAT